MNKGRFYLEKLYIYRFRYWIGYSLVGIGLIFALVFAGINLPGGISTKEIQSVIKSSSISIQPLTNDMINLPFHFLQKLSLHFLGVSTLSIKLPSIILAFLSIIGLVLLLRQWFKPSIAILASLIAITAGQFLFIAQNGTPDIMYIFWPVWLILFASLIPIQKKSRILVVIMFFTVAALSLYTPLIIYVLMVIAIAIIIHPHLRYLIKQLSMIELVVGFIIILTLSTPLILSIIKSPDMGLVLLGIPKSFPNIYTNLLSLGNQYFGFINPVNKLLIAPFFELGSFLLILLGAYYTFKTRQTSKSYLLALWIICLLPILILNPDYIIVTFLPLTLLLASGLSGLLSHWYELFPRNPYARIGGLIPIMVLVCVLVLSGMNRYIYGYRYNPEIMANFTKDLQLIPSGTKSLLVVNDEFVFYKTVEKYNKTFKVIVQPEGDSFVATRAAKQSFVDYEIDKIITSSIKNDSDRFYLYKKTTN